MSTESKKGSKTNTSTVSEGVAEGVAEADFQRFLDGADLDFDIDSMDEEDRTNAEKNKRRLIKAIVQGHLTIAENGTPTFTPYSKESKFLESMTFKAPCGADFMSMDNTKARKTIAKTHFLRSRKDTKYIVSQIR